MYLSAIQTSIQPWTFSLCILIVIFPCSSALLLLSAILNCQQGAQPFQSIHQLQRLLSLIGNLRERFGGYGLLS